MRKPNLYTTKLESTIVDGKVVVLWEKTCPCCGKRFKTSSRTQKFCTSECCQKYNKRLSESRKRYDEVKSVERLRSRCHSLGTAVLEELASKGVIEKKCACCGSVEHLEVHHRSRSYYDNRPSNLQWLCTSCHHKEHARLEALDKESGKVVYDYLDPLEIYIYGSEFR